MGVLDLQISAGADDVFHNAGSHFFSATSVNPGGDAGGNGNDSGQRFVDVVIPQGAIITVANIIYTAWANQSGTDVKTTIRAHAADASGQITNDSGWHTVVDANLTAASVAWETPTLTAWTDGVEYTTPSLVTVAQEVIDRPGFNEILHFIWQNNVSDTNAIRQAESVELDGAAPKLHIEWTEVGVVTPQPIGNPGGYMLY